MWPMLSSVIGIHLVGKRMLKGSWSYQVKMQEINLKQTVVEYKGLGV